MAPKPVNKSSPAAKKAARIREKYHRGFRRSPTKAARTRSCLQIIEDSQVSIRQAADMWVRLYVCVSSSKGHSRHRPEEWPSPGLFTSRGREDGDVACRDGEARDGASAS